MNGPACGNTFTSIAAGTIRVDACQGGCGGLWFDRLELDKVDEPGETAGEMLLRIERKAGAKLDPNKGFSCPECGAVMLRHFWSVKKNVLVDGCPKCAGIWLDAGELATTRQEYPTEAERKKAAAYFDEIFGKQLAEMRAKSEEHAQRTRKIAHLFRFICPSYYLPGKQSWGAF